MIRPLRTSGGGGRAALLAACLTLAGAAPVRASAELRKELAGLAADLKQLLAGRGLDTIGLGQFTGPPTFPATAGPGINQVLTEELAKLGVKVELTAKLGLKGEYSVAEVPAEDDPKVKLLAVQVRAVVVDRLGGVVTDFSFDRKIRSEQALVELVGPTVELAPGDPPRDRDRKLRESLTDPRPPAGGSIVRAGADSKFGIEILVGDKPRPAEAKDGLAFVRVDRGEQYAVRLINDSGREMAVALTIDGLSMYTFSELKHKDGPRKGEPLYSAVILGPGQSTLIKGWHRTNEESRSFLVTAYPDTAAAQLRHEAGLGTITATFAASWEGDTPPDDEPPRRKGVTPGDGTGFGPPVNSKFTEVRRSIGVVRAAVSVRYTKDAK
jgi:hypothetical protein